MRHAKRAVARATRGLQKYANPKGAHAAKAHNHHAAAVRRQRRATADEDDDPIAVVRAGAPTMLAPDGASMRATEAAAQPAQHSRSSADSAHELEQRIRAHEEKQRHIDALKEARRRGADLDPQQRVKLQREGAVDEELTALRHERAGTPNVPEAAPGGPTYTMLPLGRTGATAPDAADPMQAPTRTPRLPPADVATAIEDEIVADENAGIEESVEGLGVLEQRRRLKAQRHRAKLLTKASAARAAADARSARMAHRVERSRVRTAAAP